VKHPSDAALGATCVAVFVVSTAFRDVYFGGVFQSVSVFVVLLIAFGIATATGLGLLWARGGSLTPLLHAPVDVLLMNLTTAGAWTCYFFALKFLDPSIVNTLFSGIGPFVIIALAASGRPIARRSPGSPLQRVLQAGVIGSLLALVWIVATGRAGFQSAHPLTALGSAGLALLAGTLITVSHLYGKRLDEAGATPDALVGTRFIGLLLTACIVIGYQGPGVVLPSMTETLRLAAAAALLIVTPVFFNQIGMAEISPLSARIMTSFGPVLVFILQQADDRIAWSTETFIAIVAYSGLVTAANLTQAGSHKRRMD
jgi:drug/metabolite transporter (DMT)-like permease